MLSVDWIYEFENNWGYKWLDMWTDMLFQLKRKI